jgi:hypothetical protein
MTVDAETPGPRRAAVSRTGHAVVAALVVSLAVYTVLALIARWWLSGLAAPVVAYLMVTRHPRARFSAYVFFTVVTVRGLFARSPLAVAFAVGALLVLQTPAARRVWPRLVRGARR